MTWLGKILAIAAVVLSLVWMWFTTSVYVARTNWKAQADQYKEAYGKARDARLAEYEVFRAEKDSLAKQLASSKQAAEGLTAQVASLQKANTDYTAQVAKLNETIRTSDVTATDLQVNIQALLDEQKSTRARSNALEETQVRLIAEKERAEKERQTAEIAGKQSAAEKATAEAARDDFRAQLAELRDRRGGGAPIPGQKAPPPIPEGLRGTVDYYEDGYASISVGLEAGVAAGQVLDVSRGGTYLGTLLVTSRVEPKSAVVQFRPANLNRTLAQLRPDELPRKGDTVKGDAGRLGTGR